MSTPPLPFLQNGLAQVAIVVPDLDKAVETYWKKFGIGPWHIYTYGKPLVKEMSYRGRPAEYKMRLALSYFGPLRIELIEPLEGDTVYADFVREHGYGVHHFGVLVDDMRAALAEAEQAGLTMTMDGAGFGLDSDGHYAYLDTEEAIGVTLELIERPKGRVEPEAIYPPQASDE
ncbi:MAG: VOC family protein [Anaerolineae bacterium]|nr:VOC family protein [Anaerolineae bacterium]